MSGTGGNPAQRRGNFASRKARGEQGGLPASSTKAKAHNYDARQYHQNANTHGIQALRTFDCPVCDSKNTIRVELNNRLREGTVRCTYCMSLRPIPEDLPYPYSTSFVPSLENKADVFFKFNEMYNKLLRKQQQQIDEDAGTGLSTSGFADGHSGKDGTRKRRRDCDKGSADVCDESHGSGRGGYRGESEDGGGLLGGLDFYPTESGALGDGVMMPAMFESAVGRDEAGADGYGVYEDGDDETMGGNITANSTEERLSQVNAENGLRDEGVNDVDLAEFFADPE